MKKGLFLAAAAIFTMLATISCDKSGSGTPDDKGPIAFTDIASGSYSAAGKPSFLKNPGPSSWNGKITATEKTIEGELVQYYEITAWGGTNISVYVDYADGALGIDNYSAVASDNSSPGIVYAGYFEGIYESGDTFYILEEYTPTYSRSAKKLSFAGTYEGSPVWVGILAYNASTWEFAGTFGDVYENCVLTLSPGTRSAAIEGKVVNSSTGLQAFEGLKYGGRVKFDPARFEAY